ncbi:sodium/solute symporter [Coraliomargarita sp. SDUM461004]|uniref:Sodium/solute symporter n=1 Tax=Thalassobacterium sedimentorum TaxID=3041258 RepID=A0ABU1ADY3_9BACT|nr:sodium/solute symporter [Coraliomargarita sp. SDUM461004]MDQ8192916.1 sodium/solute symporter [Coraliomargarita sp. SDUM461004]
MLESNFRLIDIIVLVCYFTAIGGMGYYFSRRPKTTANYFLGGNHLPAWAIGLSMVATSISSVTFIALPAAAYALDWRQLVPNMANPIIAILAIWLLIPFFRRTAQTSAFEYIEKRFGSTARLYTAFMFLVGQSIRLGSILYLIAIPINLITGVPTFWIMLITGGFVATYTIIGGIEAVVWTDVVQAFVLYFGGAVALYVMIRQIDGGLFGMINAANIDNKFSLGPTHWAPSERTIWALIIVGLTQWIFGYSADQNVIQRYLAAKNLREARKATILCALLSLPTWAFFFLLGTALYVFYQQNPEPVITALQTDAIFPQFILDHIPVGLSGLVIAGVLSAAMSSLSSSLNSFSTVATIDFLKPYLIKDKSDEFYAWSARALTLVAAALMFTIAFAFTFADKESFFDLSMKITGLIGGVVVSFFVLGFFAPIVHKKPLWQAFTIAISFNFYLLAVQLDWIKSLLPFHIHPYWVMALVNALMISLALIFALLQPRKTQIEDGLTIFSSDKAPNTKLP